MTTAAAQPAPTPEALLALVDERADAPHESDEGLWPIWPGGRPLCQRCLAPWPCWTFRTIAALRAAATEIARYRQAAIELRDARAMWRVDLSGSAADGYREAIEAVILLAAPSDAVGVS